MSVNSDNLNGWKMPIISALFIILCSVFGFSVNKLYGCVEKNTDRIGIVEKMLQQDIATIRVQIKALDIRDSIIVENQNRMIDKLDKLQERLQ